MKEKVISNALEANLAETRYKDIKIPSEYQSFINVSKKYYGINKRANDCIIEFHHPFINRKFVAEELRAMLLTDYWFYIGLEKPEEAFRIPLQMMRALLISEKDKDLHVMIIRTLLEFTQKIEKEKNDFESSLNFCCETMQKGFESDPHSFVLSARYIKRYLNELSKKEHFENKVLHLTRNIYIKNISFWEENTRIEKWLEDSIAFLTIPSDEIIQKLGKPYFDLLKQNLEKTHNWDSIVNDFPDFDQMAERFAGAVDFFPTFIEKFYFIFYLLHLDGMELHKERLIWKLNDMLVRTIDEVDQKEVTGFIDQIFDFAEGLRADHISSVLDILLTMGKKVIDLNLDDNNKLLYYFENKLITFGFETPGMVFVNEDWQLSVNSNHIKNIRVWLELIEHSSSEMERLLSALIVNLKIGGIFISDTDLFQREITKILNSNIAPYYKKVKQLTRIFPVYFSEIGAEGEIRKVTTTMDEICHRKDRLVHFLRKQVHTESNNTLIDLTRRVFRFWYDGKLSALKSVLPKNVYNSIDKESEWFAPIHKMVVTMGKLSIKDPDGLLSLSKNDFEVLLLQIPDGNERDKERLRDMHMLYAFLKEKYSFETVNITDLLRRYSFIEEKEILKLSDALSKG